MMLSLFLRRTGLLFALLGLQTIPLAWPASTTSEPESVKIWSTLSAFDPQTGGQPKDRAKLKKTLSQPLKVAGFIISNEFNSGKVSEFLLARYPGGCVHVPLPPPNNMIHVTMAPGKASEPFFGKRVVVSGKITTGGRVDSAYEMTADSVEEFPL